MIIARNRWFPKTLICGISNIFAGGRQGGSVQRAAAAAARSDRDIEMTAYSGPPMTLGNAAAARVRLVVWCKSCGYQSEPDPAEQARWYGAETPVLKWRARLVCSRCGGRDIDMVCTGERRDLPHQDRPVP